MPAPPEAGLAERLAWADKQADELRTTVANAPKDEQARTLLAALALVVAGDLERALSAGDANTAAGLRTLVEKKLHDTRWRLGVMGRDGNGGAYFALGVLALHGILGPKDEAIACQLFSSAWDKGFLDSAFRLSNCVADKDPARTESLLRSASDSGHATASEILGRRCLEAKPADLKCAANLIPAAADAGRPTAKSLLGWMYMQGIGVPADTARGVALYLEAAKGGALSAKNNLGELHETGRGVQLDAGKAFEYYREAAEAGFAPAQFNVGRLYAAGVGTPKDFDKARTWLNAALQAGIQPARKILDWLDTQPR
ncbi:MAG: sel1 repeat family protein [Proteobacteria bacterium]|nr:sel1 repeat family protein [Pseudomonadota bacterium]